MLRRRFRRYFVCCRWRCHDRCASSADAIWLESVCILLCSWRPRRCCCYFCFVLGCCANADSNCATSTSGPSTPTNIDTIVAANFVCCICAIFDCANSGWSAAEAMSVHRSCRNFCEKSKKMNKTEAKNGYGTGGLP